MENNTSFKKNGLPPLPIYIFCHIELNNYVILTNNSSFKKLVSTTPPPLPTYILCHIEHKRCIACPLLVAEVVRLHLKKKLSTESLLS